MVDNRTNLSKKITTDIHENFGNYIKVFNNTINSLGSGIGTITGGDALGGANTGILITGDKNSVKYSKLEAYNNTIIAKGDYTVMIDKRNIQVNTVTDNYLVSGKLLGDSSVNASKSNNVYNNSPDAYPTVIVVKDNELFINESYTISLTDIHGNVLAGMDIIIKLGDNSDRKVRK